MIRSLRQLAQWFLGWLGLDARPEDQLAAAERRLEALRRRLRSGIRRLGELEAGHLRAVRSFEARQQRADQLEQDARQALEEAQGRTLDPTEADEIAGAALAERARLLATLTREQREIEKGSETVRLLESRMRRLEDTVSSWERRLGEAKVRGELAATALEVDRELALGEHGSMTRAIDDLDSEVDKAEALAAAYREIAEEDRRWTAERSADPASLERTPHDADEHSPSASDASSSRASRRRRRAP